MPNELNPFSDRIHIEQLEISARVGVPEKERSTPQRLTVSISFWPYYEQRDMADKIDNTGVEVIEKSNVADFQKRLAEWKK